MSPNYRAYVRGVRELHRLAAAGKEDSPEAEAVRDATDPPWEALSEIERERVGNLSEDLYSLVEPAPALQPMVAETQAKFSEAIEARQRGEWDKSLALLRELTPFLAPDVLSFLRGRIWLDAGDRETATLFFEHAAQLQPDNGDYQAVFLAALEDVDPKEAHERAREILQIPDRHPPNLVIRAAGIVFDMSRSSPEIEASEQFRRLARLLDSALSRLENLSEAEADSRHYGIGVLLLAFCHELIGNSQAAVETLSRGLRRDPYNSEFLATRGLLLYGTSPSAINDLELAIASGAAGIWPYYCLAHHYLVNGRLEECRTLCERALNISASAAVLSEIAEWHANAQARLGFPPELVRSSYDKSIRFDPSNQRAKKNLSTFESIHKPIGEDFWETRSASALRAATVAERRSSPSWSEWAGRPAHFGMRLSV